MPVGGHPISGDVGGDILGGDTLGLELLSELIERDPQGRGDRRFGSHAGQWVGFRKLRQQLRESPRRIGAGSLGVAGDLR